jgi:hypothetical protein
MVRVRPILRHFQVLPARHAAAGKAQYEAPRPIEPRLMGAHYSPVARPVNAILVDFRGPLRPGFRRVSVRQWRRARRPMPVAWRRSVPGRWGRSLGPVAGLVAGAGLGAAGRIRRRHPLLCRKDRPRLQVRQGLASKGAPFRGGFPAAFSRCPPRPISRRGAGAVERGGLENRCARKRTEGSNPSPSANPRLAASTRAPRGPSSGRPAPTGRPSSIPPPA